MYVATGTIALAALWTSARAGTHLLVGLLIFLCGMTMVAVTVRYTEAVYLQVMTNCLLVVTGIWLIVYSTTRRITHYFYPGISIILLTALLRDIDLIGDYVGTAIMFAGFVAILLGAAKYWQKRQFGHTPS